MKYKIENLTAKNKQIILFLSLIILHYTLFIIGCSNPSESSKALFRYYFLEEEEDHSGIKVAIYALAYLDTTIVRINSEYPHIGVIINQHTEFDHRLQSSLYQTTTSADGAFKIKDIPSGRYNFVASKSGWGFRYLYEVEISKGENSLNNYKFSILNSQLPEENQHIEFQSNSKSSNAVILSGVEGSKLEELRSDITLYPETALSGNVEGEHIFESHHHYVIEDHTSFVPGSRLEIQPGAVIRINHGKEFKNFWKF